MADLLGEKGAHLAELTKIGIPVPFGFTISTESCKRFYENGGVMSPAIRSEICAKVSELEDVAGRRFGDAERPLLVALRGDAPSSMNGRLGTVLCLGLNEVTLKALECQTGDKRFGLMNMLDFIHHYSILVYKIADEEFVNLYESKRNCQGLTAGERLSIRALEELEDEYLRLVEEKTGKSFPQDPLVQLEEGIIAILKRWMDPDIVAYRKSQQIPDEPGAAITVQSMVFGNNSTSSGSGIVLTRNPSSGEKRLFGDFLIDAKGSDMHRGTRKPMDIGFMEAVFPEAYERLMHICSIIENHYRDLQYVEFTVEDGKLYILQTRRGRRTAQAAVKMAVDMVKEELIDRKTAVLSIDPEFIEKLLAPRFDPEQEAVARIIAEGSIAAPGCACGRLVFSSEQAMQFHQIGEPVILVQHDLKNDDLPGVYASEGLIVLNGSATTSSFGFARQSGRPCVTSVDDQISISADENSMTIGEKTYYRGEYVSINGTKGMVYEGKVQMVPPDLSGDFGKIMGWADEFRTMKVKTNANTPEEAKQGAEFGAEGIGLCRSEHMFYKGDRLKLFQRLLLSGDETEQKEAMEKIRRVQQQDYFDMFTTMEGLPVNIRLLDLPLQDFLPDSSRAVVEFAEQNDISAKDVQKTANSLREMNPMFGLRGCRLSIMRPEFTVMQTQAIITAAIEAEEKMNREVDLEIIIPFVVSVHELNRVSDIIRNTADAVMKEAGHEVEYRIGTMLEVPRACMRADVLAESVDSFSFGTNDLTQTMYGLSRHDTTSLISDYIDQGIFNSDPFKTIDREGIGHMMNQAIELGKRVKPNLRIGVCGQQSGDQQSIEFFHQIGVNYVSCSPLRVPVARLAAAQAAIKSRETK